MEAITCQDNGYETFPGYATVALNIPGGELGSISHVREKVITHDDPSSGLPDVSLQVTKPSESSSLNKNLSI